LCDVFLYERGGWRVVCSAIGETPMAELLTPTDDPRHIISERAWFRDEGDLRVVFAYGLPLLQYERGDRAMDRFAVALLTDVDAAGVEETAAAFGVHRASVGRWRAILHKGGVAALMKCKPGPKGPHTFGPAIRRQVIALRKDAEAYDAIAAHLGMSKGLVYAICAQAGLTQEPPSEPTLPGLDRLPAPPVLPPPRTSADVDAPAAPPPSKPSAPTQMSIPSSREAARVEAQLKLTPDGEARTCFETSCDVRHVGVLLALPMLPELGLIDAARAVYGRMRDAVYGLRATIVVLFAMALLRIKRAEGLKGIFPDALGRVLGLLRVPEMKTLRRKLAELSLAKKAHELVMWLARRRGEEAPRALGLLYVDGHVRPYYGKKWLPKGFISSRKQVLPAITDYWVNDRDGQPVLVLPTEANPGLVKVLPEIAAAVREVIGKRRATIVFDRGGWSPELFAKLLSLGFDVLTYRKGRVRPLPRSAFHEETTHADGRRHTYRLGEATTRLKGAPLLRRIAVARPDGKETEIVTSRQDLPAALLAYRMFERWRQENFFKYLKEEFAIDGLVEYADEPADPERSVPNPRKAAESAKLAEARADVARLERELGEKVEDNAESRRATVRGFKIAHAQLRTQLEFARRRVEALEESLRAIPARVAVKELVPPGEQVVKLAPEQKLLTDAVKMAAYRAESKLVEMVRPHFARTDDEGRIFVKEVLDLCGDLEVDGDEVRVVLQPMSAPRFTRVLETLCKELNDLQPRFPESPYRLRYAVRAVE